MWPTARVMYHCLHVCHICISGTSLEEGILVPAGLKNGDAAWLLQKKWMSWCANCGAHSLMASVALKASRWQMRGLSRSTLEEKVA